MQPSDDNPNLPSLPSRASRSDFQLMGELDEAPQPNAAFPFQRVLKYLRRLWWLPVGTFILGAGIAAILVWFKPPTYVSTASMVEPIKLRLPEGGLFSEDDQTFAGTQTEMLKSSELASRTVAYLRASSNGVSVVKGRDGNDLPVEIRVSSSSKSALIGLQATSSRQAYTQAYLDALMTVYLDYKRTMRKSVSGDTLASVTDQLQRAERDLRAEQDIFTAFQRTNNLAILEEEGRIAGGYLARLRTDLSDLELEKRMLEGTLASFETGSTNMGDDWPVNVNAGANSTSPGSGADRHNAYRELELLKMERERLSRNLRPKHPKIVKLDADINRAERLLEIYQRQNRDQLLASQRAIRMKMENVKTSISEWERKVVEANTRIGEAERIRINVQRVQSVYERLAMLVQNVNINRNIEQESLSVFQPASPARRSYSKEISVVALGVIGGLALGIGIIVLLALRDDRLTSPVEVGEKVGQVIVGQVPEVPGLELETAKAVLQIDDPRHIYSESFRNLRSALMFMPGQPDRHRVLLVTSAVPNEGKSTVAANLARALAFGGSRVILVDADLRKGVLHKLVGLERGPGMAEVLSGTGDLREVTQTNCINNLDFMGAGQIAKHSSDLLLGPRFDELIAELRQSYDYVVLDSSPIFATDDAPTLAPKVDGTLFVVRNGYSRLGQVREALEQLYLRNAKVLGVVFNQADSASNHYYYKYADYYHAVPTA